MRKIYKILTLISLTGMLTACLEENKTIKEVEHKDPNKVTIQTTNNQLSAENYRAVITDGKYVLGASASSDYTLSSTGNAYAFEEGALRIAREVFPTDQYYLQEGQLIDGETLKSWVGRESEDNPEGLNPAVPVVEDKKTTSEESQQTSESTEVIGEMSVTESGEEVMVDENGSIIQESTPQENAVSEVQSTPIYLSQIMEKNIMVETQEGYQLAGIVLGLSMNSAYQYTDPQGVVYEQEISMGEMRERGRAYANIIVGRLRATEQLRSIPILVGIYRQTPEEEIIGGTYVLDGISREGNAVSDWTERNEYRVALPVLDKTVDSDQYAYFDDFSNQIKNFFPNLNGISGEALYVNDTLESLEIEVVTQFYKITEITALCQYITDVAQRVLPDNVSVEIKIQSNSQLEAYIGRQSGQTEFQHHIFKH